MRRNIITYILVAFLALFFQRILLSPQLQYGFHPDDWWPLYEYQLAGPRLIPAFKEIYSRNGIYTTYQVYYIGILHSLFKTNYFSYQLLNQSFKYLSVITFFSFVLVVFKRRLLAFLASILYAISYATVDTFQITAKGTDYLAMAVLCLFGITYYKSFKDFQIHRKYLILSVLLLILGLVFSPIRTYPIIAIIALIELVATLRHHRRIFSSTAIFSPFIFAVIVNPGFIIGNNSLIRFLLGMPVTIFKYITLGNWQLILSPFASLGSTVFLQEYGYLFGRDLSINSFSAYLTYFFQRPTFSYLVITFLFSLLISSKKLSFFVKVFLTNTLLNIIMYFILKNEYSLPTTLQLHYDTGNIHFISGGIYLTVLSLFTYLEWLKNKSLHLLVALWGGTLFSSIFIWLTWILTDYIVVFKGAHSYLTFPAMGTSLFIGGIVVLVYEKLKRFHLSLLAFLLIIPIFITSKQEISRYLSSYLEFGMKATEQVAMRDEISKHLTNFNPNEKYLFYFTTDYKNGRFYEISVLGRFYQWLYFRFPPRTLERCLAPQYLIGDITKLKASYTVIQNIAGFNLTDQCINPHFYPFDHFYAIQLQDRQATDIKQSIIISVTPHD